MRKKFSGVVHHGDLATCSQSGIDAQNGDGARGSGQQQVLQVVAENLDGVGIGSLLQLKSNLPLNRRVQQAAPCVVDGDFELWSPVPWLLEDASPNQRDRRLPI